MAILVFATVPEPKDLGQYPAVERRLGTAVPLRAIEDLQLATQYVADYLRAGRTAFEEAQKEDDKEKGLSEQERRSLEPVTKEVIQEVYEKLRSQLEDQPILPGYFLPEIRRITREKVEGEA